MTYIRIAIALLAAHWRLLIIAAAMATACPCAAAAIPETAMDNPYKINDELYRMYNEAYMKRTRMEGVTLSQRMYDRAVQMGDRKAQCIALTIPVIYYTLHIDEAKFNQAVKAMQDKAMEYGYEQYYYFGVTNKVNLLVNLHRTPEAYDYLSAVEQQARKRKSMYGIYTTLNSLGQLHYIVNECGLAIDCYKRALKIGEQSLKGQDMAPQYRKIAECYENLYDYPTMLEYAEKGFNIAKTPVARLRTIRSICYAAFMLGKYDTFLKYYNAYTQIEHQPDPKSPSLHEREVAILKMMHDRRFEEAEKTIDALPLGYYQHQRRMKAEICKLQGNHAAYATWLSEIYRKQIFAFDSVKSLNFAYINSSIADQMLAFDNQRLAIERQKLLNEQQRAELHNSSLELANTQLSLNNSDMELQRTRSEAKLMRYSYNNKQLEAGKLRSELAAQHAEQRLHDIMLMAVTAIAAVIAVAVWLFVRSHNRLMARLRQTNDTLAANNRKLTEAKNHAEDANRAKTTFINNMEDDIRTPLNNITRLANSIASASRNVPRAKIEVAHRQMLENTDQLLNIVGDVLKKAQA